MLNLNSKNLGSSP